MDYSQLVAKQRQDFADAAAPAPTVIVLNKEGANPVLLPQVIDLDFQLVMNDVGQASFTVPLDDMTFHLLGDAHPDEAIPVVVQVGFVERVWFATHVTEGYHQGEETITVSCVSPEKHLQSLFGWPNPNLLPELQVSKIRMRLGPVALLVKNELLRPNFERMGRKVGGQVHYVADEKAADAYTRQTVIGIQMNETLDMIQSLLNTDGLTLVPTVYLPGRGQNPPRGHRTDRMAIEWDVVQRAELPAGGLLFQGIVKSAAEFWRDAWTTITGFVDYDTTKQVEYWGKPQMILRRSQYDDLDITTVKPTASTYTVGGKPNDMIDKMISGSLKQLISLIPPPFNIILDVAGLDDILEGRLFAYHSFDDQPRRERMGPLGMFENFSPSTGLSLDAIMLLREAQYETRATRSHEVSLGGTAAFTPGEEFDVGTMLALELPRDRYVVSFVTQIAYSWSVDDDAKFTVQVADRPRRSPVEATMGALHGLATLTNKLTLTE